MKSNCRIIILAIAIMFVAVSCGGGNSVDAALAQIEKAMEKVEKNKTSMTEADWLALSEEIEQPLQVLNAALENNNVSGLKKIKISAVVLRYAALASEAAFHTVIQETNLVDSISKMQEIIGSEEMKEAMQELQKASEELQKLSN